MKKENLFLVLIILFSFFQMSCKEDIDGPVLPSYFSIDSNYLSLDFKEEGGVTRVPISTNIDWKEIKIEVSEDWCDAEQHYKEKDNLLVSVAVSTEKKVREATIILKTELGDEKIVVRQLGDASEILLSSTKYSASAEESVMEIRVTTNIDYQVSSRYQSDWLQQDSVSKNVMTDSLMRWTILSNPNYEDRTETIYFHSIDKAVIDSCVVTQKAKTGNPGDVIVTKDIPHKPNSGRASEHQPGQGIENTWDGKFGAGSNPYHSIWSQSADFPVKLEYFFDQTPDLNYLIYYPRGGNGNFGKLKVYIKTEGDASYQLMGNYDFKMKSAPSKITFPKLMENVEKVKFEIESGSSNFVSCDEMEFYQYATDNQLHAQLLSVFTDLTCTELVADVTDEDIALLPGYFTQLATVIKNNTYSPFEKEFRIQNYKAYSDPEVWAERLITKRYTFLDNCTGIYANAGDTIIMLVGDTQGKELQLQVIKDLEASGDSYFLKEGVNKVPIRNKGMLFLVYTAELPAQDVTVHIPYGSGVVNGFFDLETHKTDVKYAELLRQASYKYFFVRGERMIFYFHREKLLEVVPNEILSAINLWDDMVRWQQEMMGVADIFPSQMNNHIFSISPEEGYMWASDYQIGFVYTYLHNILLKEQVMATADNAWGPAHEIGHIHQGAINWPSSTESSNNLFSNYTIYKLGKYCSRGSELSVLADHRLIKKNAWAQMEFDNGGEHTELHMRMNWQLWNYFHRCGYKTDFWHKLFVEMRKPENKIDQTNPGEGQLLFAKMASKVANQDLSDFFDLWGFFMPVDQVVDQYGTWNYLVTEEMINEAKTYMQQFPKMKHAIQYIEDRRDGDVGIGNYQVGDVGHYSQFEDNGMLITRPITYRQSGRNIEILNGDEAVAFEVVRDGELLYFSNFFEFEIPAEINLTGIEIQAVESTGKRIILKQQ